MKPAFLVLAGALIIGSVPLIKAYADDAATPSSPAASQKVLTPSEAQIKKLVEDRFKITIDEVTPMPFNNLYELRVGGKVIYADAKGEYVFVGNVIDLKSQTNLTQARTDALADAALPKVKFSELPLTSAIKIVRGNGRRQMAIFEDPNCVYCKRLEKTVTALNDVTVYVFLYPVLGPDSIAKSKDIWCAKDPVKTWDGWMLEGTPFGSVKCDTSTIDRNLDLGDRLQVTATPTIFFQNGRRVPGAIPPDELDKLLTAGAAAAG